MRYSSGPLEKQVRKGHPEDRTRKGKGLIRDIGKAWHMDVIRGSADKSEVTEKVKIVIAAWPEPRTLTSICVKRPSAP